MNKKIKKETKKSEPTKSASKVKAKKPLPINKFKAVTKDNSTIVSKVTDFFNNENLPIVLVDKKSRDALQLTIGQIVKVKHGINTSFAVVERQFRELIGTKSATINNLLAQKIDANDNDIIEIVAEGLNDADKQAFMIQYRDACMGTFIGSLFSRAISQVIASQDDETEQRPQPVNKPKRQKPASNEEYV